MQLTTAALCALTATQARAHEAPYGGALLHDEALDTALLVTNRGLILRDPQDNDRFQLLCNEALGIPTTPLPQVELTAAGALVVATTGGLRRSEDGGCNWEAVPPFERDQVSALAADPGDHDHLVAASNGAERSAVHQSLDGGRTWTELHSMDRSRLVQSLAFSPHEGGQLFATGTAFTPVGIEFFLMRSQDAGTSWDTFAIPAAKEQSRMLLQAIHPMEPQTVLLSSVPFDPDHQLSQLWLSEDGGETFASKFTAPAISAARYDGRGRLWVAAGDGLYVYSEELTGFTQVTNAERLSCLSVTDDAIWACGQYDGPGTTGVGHLDPPEDIAAIPSALSRLLEFADVDAPLDCPEDSQAATTCAKPWYDWEIELLGKSPSTMPAPTEPVDAGAQPEPSPREETGDDVPSSPSKTGGACRVGSPGGFEPSAPWPMLAAFIALLGTRRRYSR